MAFYQEDGVGLYNGRVVDKPSDLSQYTAITLDPEFDLDLSGNATRKPALTGTIHTFQKKRNPVYGQIEHAVKPMLSIRSARRGFALIVLNIIVLFIMLSWVASSNSLSLRAFTYLCAFDLFTLLTYMVSLWLTSQQENRIRDSIHTFSQERVEILFVFSSVVVAILGAIFVIKESFLRTLEQPDIAIGRLIPGALLGFCFHVVLAFSIKNKPLQSISEASSSSIIQEHVSDLTQPLCSVIPFLKRILQPRVDPFFLLSFVGACLLLLTDLLIQIDLYFSADTAAAFLLALCTVNTMWPLGVCSGKILLNTTPPYLLAQLDKLLSEAQTLDGVLEIRNERFYTISLSSKSQTDLRSRNGYGLVLIGSISVRVRRDANEQMVLAHVTNRLSPLVSQLTVQFDQENCSQPHGFGCCSPSFSPTPITMIVKDEWSASAVAPPPGVSANVKSPIGSSIIYGFNKPAAAVAPYLQTPPKKITPVVLTATEPELKPRIGENPSAVPPVRSVPIADDFSFTVTASTNKSKSSAYSSAGVNIARMYKAAGFTSPPAASKRSSSMFLSK